VFLADVAPAFVRSRLDVGDGTRATYDTNLGRILPHPIAKVPVDRLAANDVAGAP
jgi:hypothetical protein